MKIQGSLLIITALLAGCSGNHNENQFDTNAAEMNALPGDKGRGNSETNGEAAKRGGGDERGVFEYKMPEPAESAVKHPIDTLEQPVQRDRIAEKEKGTGDDNSTNKVEEKADEQVEATDNATPKTKKQERKERRAKRKADKSS